LAIAGKGERSQFTKAPVEAPGPSSFGSAMDVQAERMAVELVKPSPDWILVAENESQRLAAAIGETLVVIHHIGSTAIPGIMAKPTIDLMPLLRSIAALDERKEALLALGYEWKGEFGLPGRRFLTRTQGGKRLFNVHCYEATNPEVTRHLAFRDYLRAHADVARAYEAEKVRARSLQPNDVLAYNDVKNDWIKATEQRALDWYRVHSRA
jgi:GrpB-like predicted nucleotidyltransferase (UPF0157 family)